MNRFVRTPFACAAILLATTLAFAQSPANNAVIGAVTAIRADTSELDIKQDNGAAATIHFTSATTAQRVAPGQTDLSKAASIKVAEVAPGDRVLITLDPAAGAARRIVVMASSDLAKRDAEDRLDWTKRGVAGVVTAIKDSEILLEQKTLGAPAKFTVKADDKTSFKRYASDSIRFADAKSSNLSAVRVGDQLRARGEKSADGLTVEASEVIFGTFVSKAGTITAINAETKEVTVKDLVDKKATLTIRFTADSQIKRMPEGPAMAALMAAGRGRGPATPASGGAPAARPALDVAQMLESIPASKFEDIKTGDTVVLSATVGTRSGQFTAITFLANAEALVQLAVSAAGKGGNGPAPSLAGLASSISSIGP